MEGPESRDDDDGVCAARKLVEQRRKECKGQQGRQRDG